MMDATQLQTNQKATVDKLMSDRVVLITGASRGIGAATAKLLGRQGVGHLSPGRAGQPQPRGGQPKEEVAHGKSDDSLICGRNEALI